MPPPVVTLTAPQSPTRARSVSQPIREDVATDFYPHAPLRSHSSNSILRTSTAGTGSEARGKGRARSSSLVTVTEVGGDEPENVVDRLGVGSNENAAWVNAPGRSDAWQSTDHRRLGNTYRAHSTRKDTGRRDSGYDPGCGMDRGQPRLHGRIFLDVPPCDRRPIRDVSLARTRAS